MSLRGSESEAATIRPRVVIVGGGFTGAAVAVHLALHATRRMRIEVIEPREMLGGGVAYSSPDPAHRTNVHASRMSLFSDDAQHFDRWLHETGALVEDPAAALPDGRTYPRRAIFGRYVADTLRRIAAHSLAEVVHVRERAVSIAARAPAWSVGLASGRRLAADLLVLAVSHPPPVPPAIVSEPLQGHSKFVADPWQPNALNSIESTDSVIIVGTALSMADVVASLERRGHRGPIIAFSRRGLLSRPHATAPHQPHGEFARCPPRSARALLRAVRQELHVARSAGQPWQAVVDALRRDGQAIWSCLDERERGRLLRHLRPYWEVHRYRVAPQIARIIERRRATGSLQVVAARLAAVERAGPRIRCSLRPRHSQPGRKHWIEADALVVTTGPGHAGVLDSNPVLRSLADQGWIAADRYGLGLAVDREHRALTGDGRAAPSLLVAGPLARATFGELMGLPQVTMSAEAVAAAILGTLGERPTASAELSSSVYYYDNIARHTNIM